MLFYVSCGCYFSSKPHLLKTQLALVVLIALFAGQSFVCAQSNPSWQDVKRNRKGTIRAVWFESTPFIYADAAGKVQGIEYELVEGFRQFLLDRHGISLTIDWEEGQSFSDTYNAVRDGQATFALSAFSITQKRNQEVDFSPPYMSDISVLITSDNVPIFPDNNSFYEIIPRLTAITIRETTYEQELLRFQNEAHLPFSIKYIPSSQNIMYTIAQADSAFGFIDLPVYMMLFNNNPSIKVKRQNILPIKREGYALAIPERSDWVIPLQEYFSQPDFRSKLEKIISAYVDIDLYHFVEGLAINSDDQAIQLLTKEKEIQYKDLVGKADIIVKETRARNFLIALMGVTLTSLVVIITLYRKRNEQKEKIEAQGKSIELKSRELEQRNQHLVTLDEEKNNLIRILAHDLRTPINHIQGLAQLVLLEKSALSGEQNMMVGKIVDSSVRLNKMITHLLDIDALENNRVKLFLEKIDLCSVLTKVVNSFERQAASKNITLHLQCTNDMSMIEADSLYLFEVFENLISNAIKFSPSGKAVEISLVQNEGNVRAVVKDHGPGMTAEDHLHLFRKYQRLSARPTAGETSVGLGLSIVKKYVELMNGRVWCESELNKGASFIVEFPLSASVPAVPKN